MKKTICMLLAGVLTLSNLNLVTVHAEPKTSYETNNEASDLEEVTEEILQPIDATETKDDEQIAEMQIMKNNYLRYLCGNETLNSNENVKGKLNSISSNAKKALDLFIPETEDRSKGIFTDDDLTLRGNDSNAFNRTAKKLKEMSLAYSTAGTEYYHDSELSHKIVEALNCYYENFFNDETLLEKYFGNWWNWEIGIPTSLSSTFVMMEDEINAEYPDLMKNYVVCFDKYLQNGLDGDVNLEARQHTGANLADITMNRVLQGIVTHDSARIKKSVENMMTVYNTIDPNNIVNGNTDGVYEDGSFIQHHRVAYTGSYGKVLLGRMAQSAIVLGGTQYQPENNIATMKKWIYESFSPVMFEGYMMEIVKGRATSRTGSGYSDTYGVIDAMLQVIPYMNEADQKDFKEHVKYIATSMPKAPNASSFGISVISDYVQIMNDDSIKPVSHSKSGHFAFNSMDRNVHVRDNYAFALARSSNRISKYEYMSGENKRSWFHGDGAFYLYQSGIDQTKSYGHEFYAIAGPYRLPGTTVPEEERLTIQEWHDGKDFYDNAEAGFESGSEKQNDYVYFPIGTNHFSGSVKLDKYAAAGMQLGDDNAYAAKQEGLLPDDFVVYKNADANKAWFMFDNEIVLMTSAIRDEKGRKLVSTIDNRMSEANSTVNVELGNDDGRETVLSENGTYDNLSWIHYSTDKTGSSTGYYFPESKPITIEDGIKEGNINSIRKQNPDKVVSNHLFTMTYDHGENPQNDSYCYVILPNASKDETKAYASSPNIKVLANNDKIQAVEHTDLNMKGYIFYEPTTINGVSTNDKAAVLTKTNDGITTYVISDPTFEQDTITIELDMNNPVIVSKDNNISVKSENNKTYLNVNVDKVNGKSFSVSLKESENAPKDEWILSGNKWWYKHADGSYTKNDWELIDGKWYYFDNNGWMKTGWIKVNNNWYYLKSSGAMATGWAYVDNHWYYLKSSGAMATGWAYVDNHWYYLKSSGAMATGWAYVDSHWYYLKSSGAMATGWAYVDSHWYYLKSSGAMATGWAYVDSHWYYLKSSGAMATGWAYVDGHWYYLKSSGAMATGWMKIDNKWYYFYGNGSMAANTTINGYYVNKSGVWVR